MNNNIVLYWPDYNLTRPSRERIDALKLKSLTLASLAGAIKDYKPIAVQGNILLRHLHNSEDSISHENYLKASVKMIEKFSPDILCIANWSSNFPFTVEFIKLYKARNNCIIVLGGHPATFNTKDVLGIIPEVDFLVRGEGEIALKELMGELIKGKSGRNVKSVSYRDKNGTLKHNQKQPIIDDLDKLPMPDYTSFAKGNSKSVYTLMTERGCFYNCTFCCARVMGGAGRLKSASRVIKEIEQLNTDYIFFGSNNFTTNKDFVRKISKYLLEKQIGWHIMSRVDTVNKELLGIMKTRGCDEISFGPESINPNTLMAMNKTSKSRLQSYIKACWDIPREANKIGMKTRANVVVGFPFETKKMIIETLNYIVALEQEGIHTHASTLAVYPGTQLWDDYIAGKIELIKRDGYPPGFFAKKYDHLVWAYPDAWMVENNHMTIREFAKITYENWTSKIKLGSKK